MNNSTARPISDAQLAANRANAQHSTGPQSSAAKAAVSLNAVRTGLTGQTAVLPNEDATRYSAYIADYETEFQPIGIQERELVQSLADIRWRLNRIPALEAALDTYARVTIADQYPNMAGAHLDFILTVEVHEKNERNSTTFTCTKLAWPAVAKRNLPNSTPSSRNVGERRGSQRSSSQSNS